MENSNIFVPIKEKQLKLNSVPEILKKRTYGYGWPKILINRPSLTSDHINQYYEKAFSEKSTPVKKHFERGEQLLEEAYVDISSIYVKENEILFYIKGVCAASLKKLDRWVTVSIQKNPCEIYFAFCEFTAGKRGTCSHVFSVFTRIS